MAIKFHKDPEPPALANIHLWFDVQDAGTLFQEETRSTPVTASGQTVGAIDNKGFDPLVALTQTTAGQRPEYDTTKAGDTGGNAGDPLIISNLGTGITFVSGFPVIGEAEDSREGTICWVVSIDDDHPAGWGWGAWEQTQHFDTGTDSTMPASIFQTQGGTVKSSALLPSSTLASYYHRSNNSNIVAAKFSWDSGGGEATFIKTARVNGGIVASAAPASYFQLRSADESFYVWFQASNGAGSVSTEPVGASGTGVVVLNLVAGDGAFEIASNLNVAINALPQFTSTATNQGTLNSFVIIVGNDSQDVTLFSSSQNAASLINVSASIFSIRVAEAGERVGLSGGIGWPEDNTLFKLGVRSSTIGMRGGIGEMIHWNKILDTAEISQLESYITKKWGITWATSLLPQSENIVHRFDFSDTSTLWRDTAGTLPVSASGDAILRVDNKGFDGTALLQSNGSGLAPTWNSSTGGLNGLGVGNFNAGAVRVSAIIADSQGADLGDYTALVIAITDGFSGADFSFGWGSNFSELGTRVFAETAFHALVNGAQFSACTASVPASGVAYAVMMDNDGNDNQEVRYSFDAGASTATASSGGPQDGTVFAVGSTPAGDNAHDGRIAEVIVWTPALTSAERDAAEVYVTDRWGITWA